MANKQPRKGNGQYKRRRNRRWKLTLLLVLAIVVAGIYYGPKIKEYALGLEEEIAETAEVVQPIVPVIEKTEEEKKLEKIKENIEKSQEFKDEMEAIYQTKLDGYALDKYHQQLVEEANTVQEKLNAVREQEAELGL